MIKKDLPKISDENLYTFDGLKAIWEEGWQKFARFCRGLGFRRARIVSEIPLRNEWVVTLAEQVLEGVVRGKGLWVEWDSELGQGVKQAISFYSLLYWSLSRDGQSEHRRISEVFGQANLNRVLGALCDSDTLGEAAKKITTTATYAKFIREQVETVCSKTTFEKVRIARRWSNAFHRLQRCISGKVSIKETFWNCVWIFVEFQMKKLREIERLILEDVPLASDQIDYLNEFLHLGWPTVIRVEEPEKGFRYKLVLQARGLGGNSLKKLASSLLRQEGFLLARQLESTFRKTRFLRTCRAPSCGKVFYTSYKNATACPGSQSFKKNKCMLEWIRYRRFLIKTLKDPEKDWDDEQNKKNFISYAHS